MDGAVELFKACRKHDVKPILGLEAYFVDDRRIKEGKVERNHLTLLAEDDEGFRNLTKLSSAGFLQGLHRGKPGVDMDLLSRHAKGVIAFSREMRRPLVATADVHYLRREDYHHHAALLCVQTKSTLAQPKMSFDTNEFYLKTSQEMAESFAATPEALASTLEIAERCEVGIELGKQLIPRFDCPEGKDEK